MRGVVRENIEGCEAATFHSTACATGEGVITPAKASRRQKDGAVVLILVLMTVVLTASRIGAAVGDGQNGASLFAANCARCHGKEAKGDGPDLIKLQSAVSPVDWNDKESNQELTDSFIFSMITKGGKANGKSRIMPAFGHKLNSQQVQDLLAFIRSRAK
jgi:mono/diheme cytochrome c family protein